MNTTVATRNAPVNSLSAAKAQKAKKVLILAERNIIPALILFDIVLYSFSLRFRDLRYIQAYFSIYSISYAVILSIANTCIDTLTTPLPLIKNPLKPQNARHFGALGGCKPPQCPALRVFHRLSTCKA